MPSIPKKQRYYLGVDPGKSGGLAILSDKREIARYHPFSTLESDLDLYFFLQEVVKDYVDVTGGLERVHSMPGEGHVGAFSFGENYGKLQMAITANHIPYEKVTPRTWQKGLGIKAKEKTESKPQFKERLRQQAQQLFPTLALWKGSGKLTLQRAVCDAMLIAEYTRRKHEGLIKE